MHLWHFGKTTSRSPVFGLRPAGRNSAETTTNAVTQNRIFTASWAMRGSPAVASAEGAEGRIVVEFVEAADLLCTVYGSRADALRSEVGMVEYVEVLPAELNPQAFGHDEILGKLYVPVRGLGQAIRDLADVAEGAEDGWIIGSTRGLGGLKSTWVQPAYTGCSDACVRAFAIRIAARDKRSTIRCWHRSEIFCAEAWIPKSQQR